MGFETMGGMKVLALKGIEKQGNLWAVRYTRHHGRNVQDAIFFCDTPDSQGKVSRITRRSAETEWGVCWQ